MGRSIYIGCNPISLNATLGGRLSSETYPGGSGTDYNYGSTGTLNTAISRLDHMSESGTTLESYKYMGLGTVVEKDHPQDGVNLTYMGTANGDAGDTVVGLDRFGRVTGQYWVSGTTNASTQLDAYAYTYDADGNVLSKSNLVNSSFSENYTYDGLSRLTAVSRGTSSQSFSLNNIGAMNSVTTNGTVQNHTTNDENQITNIGSSTISYDSNGNVTTDDHRNTLVYDSWNRLVEVKASNGTIIAGYTYDGYGRMTSETNVTTTTDLYYSGTQDIEERIGVTDYTGASLSSNGTTTLTNVYSPDYTNDILLRDSGGTRVYFTHDANFNVTGVVQNSTTGTMLQRMVYDAYGAVKFYDGTWTLRGSDSLSLKYLYQGMRYDSTTGWYLTGQTNHDRWYSPTMDVWNREDDAGDVNGLNTYGFAVDNPIIVGDPTGMVAPGGYGSAGGAGGHYNPYPNAAARAQALANQQAAMNFMDNQVWPRVEGGMQMVGGAIEFGVGVGASEVGIGLPVAFNGWDNAAAGLSRLWSGQYQQTLTSQAIQNLTGSYNAGEYVNFALGLLSVPVIGSLDNLATQGIPDLVKSGGSPVIGNVPNSQEPINAPEPSTPSANVPLFQQSAATGISDDAIVHFSPEPLSVVKTNACKNFSFKYGDIKHLTPTQVETVIGPLSGSGQAGGAAYLNVVETPPGGFEIQYDRNPAQIPEYVGKTDLTVTKSVKVQ